MIRAANAAPKKRAVTHTDKTVRFLNKCIGIIGSFANRSSITTVTNKKNMPIIRQTRTGAELHGYCIPPKLRATRTNVANVNKLIVPGK